MSGSEPDVPARVYLAGPEVFLADALDIGAEKRRLCAAYGFDGVFPMDVEIERAGALPPLEVARRISHANETLMQGCDLVIANCTPFRGVSLDAGTAFEIGYMRALGRPVFGYTNIAASYRDRAHAFRLLPDWRDGDREDFMVEDFGLAENLMIDIALRETGFAPVCTEVAPGEELSDLRGFEACLTAALATLRDARRDNGRDSGPDARPATGRGSEP